VSIVRWIAGEGQAWLRVRAPGVTPTDAWLQDTRTNAFLLPGNGLTPSFIFGIPARLSYNFSADSYFQDPRQSNSIGSSRSPTPSTTEEVISTVLCLNLANQLGFNPPTLAVEVSIFSDMSAQGPNGVAEADAPYNIQLGNLLDVCRGPSRRDCRRRHVGDHNTDR
jgi:hypothetical protein